MNTKYNKTLSILLMSLLAASAMAIAVPRAKAQPTTLAIVPNTLEFGPDPCVGTVFQITCEVFNVTDLYGVDIQIGWDTDWIRYVNHTKHIPVDTYPDGILYAPTVPVKDDVDESASMSGAAPGTMYWLAEASMTPAPSFSGHGVAFSMNFTIVNQPGVGEPDAVFQIGITSSTLSDSTGSPMTHTVINATVTIHAPEWIAPPKPLLKVMPEETTGTYGELFNIDIYLMDEYHGDLNSTWDVAGFDIHLTFNATLIQGMNVIVDPDGWFASFWPNGVFTVKSECDNVAGDVWIAFLGIPGTNGTHTPPYGQGRLATITFNATYEALVYPAPCCALALGPTTIAGFPHPERPYAPWNGLETSPPLPHVTEDGLYCAPLKRLGRVIDIYTNYPEGFNGVGPNEPSDLVWPQKSIIVYAKVTYNDWPEQNKDVAFQVMDPNGKLWAVYYNRTGSDGITWVFIRLPWPCDNPEDYLGEWTIIATVDIACQVVNDTLTFKYDYFVNIWKVTVTPSSVAHGECFNVTIDYGTYWMQNKEVLFTVTAVDETGVPFAFNKQWVTIGGATYCSYANGTITIELCVPKFARAGTATIYVNALSNWPDCGGCPLYKVMTATIGIQAS